MKRKVIISILVLTTSLLMGQNILNHIPKAEMYDNTFYIQIKSKAGTSFFIESSGKEYLITAKHILPIKTKNGDSVKLKLSIKNKLLDYSGIVYFHSNEHLDIAVIRTNEVVNKPYNLSKTAIRVNGAIIGQDCYFLGYPYLKYNTNTNPEIGAMALVKKGIISAFYKENGITTFLVDGHNNPGFSGGPVLYYNYEEKKIKVLGVISSYVAQNNKGEVLFGTEKTKFNYMENSGIVKVHPGDRIEEIIKINSL